MFSYLTMKKMKAKDAVYNFIHEERGASDIVAVMLIVLVVVAAAFVFKEKIMELIEGLFGGLDKKIGPLSDPRSGS